MPSLFIFTHRRGRGFATALAITLTLLAAGSPILAQGKEATRVRILAVADTDAHNANIFGLGLDGQNVRRCFEELFDKAGKNTRYTLDLYVGDQVTPLNIMNYYNNLKTNPSETLVFYYTGHGITKNPDGHIITTHRGFLPRKLLLEAMQKSNPQLVVALIDCCANYGNGPPGFNPFQKAGGPDLKSALPALLRGPDLFTERQTATDDRLRPKTPGVASSGPLAPAAAPASAKDVLSQLFFQHRGLVDINAAALGQSASGNAQLGGSYFTIALTKLLRKTPADLDRSGDGFVEWREFYPHLHQVTKEEAARGSFTQVPQAFSLGEALK